MRKSQKVPAHRILLAFIILPFTVTVLIPVLLHVNLPIELTGPVFDFPGRRWFVLIPVAIGLILLYTTNILFVREGRGTLAPWSAPEKLVIKGPYRHMRQPMIAGVCLILVGEILFFASWAAVIWFSVFLIGNLIYIPLLEEKKLLHRFGDQYHLYRQNVRSWIPRIKPWDEK